MKKMEHNVDIIFAEPIGCYVEIRYDTVLRSIRFIRTGQDLIEKRTQKASFELDEYFRGERKAFSCDYDLSGYSVFFKNVMAWTASIGYGTTTTYSELARNVGTKSSRAVGRALANNPIPIIIPCHRIVAKNGLGGYSGGIDLKTRLLELEQRNL